MTEIERKFLLKNTDFLKEKTGKRITQGYLTTDKERTVRVRIKGEKAFLTIKGKSNDSGLSRYEWEKEIDLEEAQQLLLLCLPGVIDKTRYEIAIEKHVWEIDIFHGENNGLTLAEIELQSETESFSKPEWIDKEVTGDVRYYNSYISEKPFCEW
ncbi:CYTH domain-containing protein [Nonlabens xylanidelens]|uniref:CYTH domain-containing protein n=1 Tax=Nonlabens xylanidelens TaxID=191564 RepID=A0A2S6IR08_9FLAO|nr:CYTH domain-containing protein [Nonlabens xylanidelens]PPK96546.1 CYTH domain-containing protein [Nonlabens xylanidelens]PQJ13269.1 adenylate cyclase [Nonlabens xylanidelens]